MQSWRPHSPGRKFHCRASQIWKRVLETSCSAWGCPGVPTVAGVFLGLATHSALSENIASDKFLTIKRKCKLPVPGVRVGRGGGGGEKSSPESSPPVFGELEPFTPGTKIFISVYTNDRGEDRVEARSLTRSLLRNAPCAHSTWFILSTSCSPRANKGGTNGILKALLQLFLLIKL